MRTGCLLIIVPLRNVQVELVAPFAAHVGYGTSMVVLKIRLS